MSELDQPLSPPGSPLRAHESIWKRSKKILGMSRFAFLQQIDAKDPNDKNPKSGDEAGKNGKPPVSKRREQVRRAQKTHRQRTENYIKALEQEVLRLQKEEADRAHERKKSQHSDAYVKTLEKQVLELQRDKAQSQQQNDMQFGGTTLTLFDQNGNWALKAEMPEYPSYSTPSDMSSPGYGSDASMFGQYGSTWQNLLLINPLANHQTAIDFVLSLEEACMAHVHQHMYDPNAINGHALTASGWFIEQAPYTVTPPSTWTSQPPSWTTSNAEIERLFELASSLGLKGELTPVEAWNRIWQHPQASSITPQGLKTIELGLRQYVACYGFGGAIEEAKFNDVLRSGIAQ